MNRRIFLRAGGLLGLLGAWLAAPLRAVAAWLESALTASELTVALEQLGATQAADSERIQIKSPALAEDGAAVAITVTSDLPEVETLTLLAAKNPQPLVAHMQVAPGAEAFLSLRARLREDTEVIALVKSQGRYFRASRLINVAVGGCGKG